MYHVVRSTIIMTLFLSAVIYFGTTPLFSQQEEPITKENATKYLYGIASWYGDQFDGQTTASGAKYAPQSLTAGHRSLPFGTRIEVENLSNGKKVQVLINDRGPFERNRVINLSKQAAEILEFLSEGTTFVKITILELGTSLPSPLGLPEPPIGKEIPQNFSNIPTEVPAVEEPPVEELPVEEQQAADYYDYTQQDAYLNAEDGYALLNDEDLFADLDNELDFMDDSFVSDLVNEDSQLKAQGVSTNFADNNPGVNPIGFDTNVQDILIDDPLSNIIVGPEDEFVAAPNPPIDVLNTAPSHLTPEEQRILEENAYNDPFSDLFNDTTEPYSFQNEVASSLTSPTVPSQQNANNIDGGTNTLLPPVKTNLTAVTNIITNSSVPKTSPVEQDNLYDDSYYYSGESADNVSSKEDSKIEESTQEPAMINNSLPSTSKEDSKIEENTQEPTMINNSLPQQETAKTEINGEPLIPQKLGNHYIIQLGAFSKQKNALNLYEKLRGSGFNAYITDVKVKGRNLMRVRVGYFTTLEDALQISMKLQEVHGIDNRIIQVDYEKK